ncbi:MAG TPA: hypothetical protein VMT30_06245, partial [Candidatus Saccharimonadia bacterium]|nr:hypothetical protein [Candidatus Saccharimonadia bacterium]
KWRWLPLIRWRYLSRAWQGYPPAGYVLASDWTGRERELIGWSWPACVHPVRVVVVEDRDSDEAYNHDTAAREDHSSWFGNERISA